MPLKKDLKVAKEALEEFTNMKPVNWLGKWSRSLAIRKFQKEIDAIEAELKRRKKSKKK
jgi:transcription initiation factor IIE alpha subunit